MTPKEKAQDLVDKFTVIGLQQRNEGYQCALIAVDEILYVLNEMDDTLSYNSSIFYNEVKKEIEKL
jgi:hypothetical protein